MKLTISICRVSLIAVAAVILLPLLPTVLLMYLTKFVHERCFETNGTV